jgi:hypothetical protein
MTQRKDPDQSLLQTLPKYSDRVDVCVNVDFGEDSDPEKGSFFSVSWRHIQKNKGLDEILMNVVIGENNDPDNGPCPQSKTQINNGTQVDVCIGDSNDPDKGSRPFRNKTI